MTTTQQGATQRLPEPGFCRLSIAHLLLLILFSALVLAYVAPGMARLLSDSRYAWSERWWVAGVWLAQYWSYAWAWFGLVVLLRERWRGPCREFAPGHWIVLIQGIATCGIVVSLLWSYLIPVNSM